MEGSWALRIGEGWSCFIMLWNWPSLTVNFSFILRRVKSCLLEPYRIHHFCWIAHTKLYKWNHDPPAKKRIACLACTKDHTTGKLKSPPLEKTQSLKRPQVRRHALSGHADLAFIRGHPCCWWLRVVVNKGVEDLASFKPSSCDFVMRYYWGGNKTSKHMLVALQLPHLLVCFSMLK